MIPFRRVLLAAGSLGLGGAERHMTDLCAMLGEKGARCEVVYPAGAGDELAGDLRRAGAVIHPLRIGSLADLARPSVYSALAGLVGELRPELVHAHLYHGEVIGALCARIADVPLLATRHSSGIEFNGFRRVVVRMLRDRYSALIAVSQEAAAEAAGQGFGPSAVHVVPNGVDTGLFRPAAPGEREERRRETERRFFGGAETGTLIGALGSLKKVKDHRTLLEALRLVAERGGARGESARLLIMGEGPQRRSLEDLAGRLGLSGRVSMPGIVSEPWKVLPCLDIFVMPSLNEGMPVALLEAMSCGTASIATDVGAVGEVLGGAGVLVPPGDPGRLADAVLALAGDPSVIEKAGRACRERIVGGYDIGSWAERTLRVYARVARKPL